MPIFFYLTQHHSDVIPHDVNLACFRKLFETVSSCEDVLARDERTTTPSGLVCLGGSQLQQGSPGKLIHLRFLATDTLELIMNISTSFPFWKIFEPLLYYGQHIKN